MHSNIPNPPFVVGWIEQGEPRFAVVTAVEAPFWLTECSGGRKRKLRAEDCAVVVQARDATAVEKAAIEAATVEAQRIWHALDGCVEAATPSDLAARLSPQLGLDAAALWLLMWRAPEWFARVGRTRFRRRSAAEVERERVAIAAKQAEQEWLRRLDHEAEAVARGERTLSEWAQSSPAIAAALASEAYGDAPDTHVPATVAARARHHIDAAWHAAGVTWPRTWWAAATLGDPNPWHHGHPRLKRRIRMLDSLPPPPLAVTAPLQPKTPLVAVDDAHTVEVDDAVGCVDRGDGTFDVEVAVADVTTGFGADDTWLDALAEWATTVYLPDGILPMLPPALGWQRHSLSATQARPAWLLRWRLDGRTAAPLEPPTLARGQVRLAAVLSYEDLDSGASHPGWPELCTLARKLEAARLAAGADTIRVPEAQVEVRGQLPVALKTATPWRGARAVIREWMLLANMAFAERLAAAGLPAPYRGQDVHAPAPRPTRVELYPLHHPGIAAAAYVYGTSPIRRLSDALVQRQLRATLGDVPLDRERMRTLVHHSEAAMADLKRWMEAAQRYWKLRYLEAFPATRLTGVLQAIDDASGYARVRVEPLALSAHVKGAAGAVGEARPLRLVAVDAETGRLDLAWD